MDNHNWHTSVILKRFGILFIFLFIEQMIFGLNPSTNLSKLIFSNSQIASMKKVAPLLFDPTIVASVKIGLSLILLGILITFMRNLIMAQDNALHLETTVPIKNRKIKKGEKKRMPTVLIVGISFLLVMAFNIMGQAVRLAMHAQHTSANQQSLDAMATNISSTLWLFLLSVFLIPIFEELLFRRLLIDFVGPESYRFQFAILSVILFTGAHMLGSTNILADAISYGGPAMVLTYLYYHYKNVRYSIYTHILTNFIAFLPLLVTILNYLIKNVNHYYDILMNGSYPGK